MDHVPATTPSSCVMTVSFSNTKAAEDAQKTCPVVACAIPVTNGTPVKETGRDGPKEKRENQVDDRPVFKPFALCRSVPRGSAQRQEEAHLSL